MIKRRSRAKKPSSPKFHFKLSGGVNYATDSEIEDNQAAYGTQNVWYDGKSICSRPGLARLFANSLGAGRINGLWDYTKKDGSLVTLVHWGNALYSVVGSNQPTLIYNALSNAKSSAFVWFGDFFLLDGTNYVVYDGTTVKLVTANAYIPVLLWGKKPDGSGGTIKERLNQLCNSWYEQFTSQGGATVYNITGADSITSIDEVKVLGVLKTAGVDYTADIAGRKITFLAGKVPADATGSITNNVQIKVTKTGAKDSNIIKKCKYTAMYGGVVWFSGNPDTPDTGYWAGVPIDSDGNLVTEKMPYYIPDDHKHIFGASSEGKLGPMIPCGNALLVFKDRATHRVDVSTSTDFDFNFKYVDFSTGCNMPGTLRIINGKPVFANTYKGICKLYNEFGLPDQMNIAVISADINGTDAHPGLLDEQETDLYDASSVDDGQRYWVCVKDKAFAWDYVNFPSVNKSESVPWWHMTNINASCWLVRDRDVFFGDRTNGLITKLLPGVLNDYGVPILHDLFTKKTDLGFPEWEKDVPRGWLIQKGNSQSRTSIEYISDAEKVTDTAEIEIAGMDIDYLDIDYMNVDAENNDQTTPLYPDITDTVQFQVHLYNYNLNEDLSLINLSIEATLTKEVD